jgi:hypothetical protein
VIRISVPAHAALIAVLMLVSACGDEEMPAPSDPASVLAGTWVGSATDAQAGQIAFRLVLREENGQISGSWTASLSPTTAATGSVSGPAAAMPLVFSLSCLPGGLGGITATRDGTQLSGTYFFIGCAGLDQGTFDVVRDPVSGADVRSALIRDRSRAMSSSDSRPMPSW